MMFIYIVKFIEKRLNYVDDEVMSDSKLVKRYCEHLMSEMNDAFIKELPEELDEHFKERTLCFAERQQYVEIMILVLRPKTMISLKESYQKLIL